ncbi:MAG: hypothetical protein A2Y54_00795 [Chloroflexi bacterium RBG_16_51_16]|nr:MAG: hypothetical protein A2Y54_00795 [Chloroflexi bacterium RBG_16_51_16]
MASENGVVTQIKEAALLTNAGWVALAERVGGNWILLATHQLTRNRQEILSRLLDKPSVDAWLCGALSGGHSRSSALPNDSGLGTKRFHIYPVMGLSQAIIVGSTQQTYEAQRIWRLTASLLAKRSVHVQDPFLPDLQADLAYDLPLALDRILGVFVHAANPQGGWIAIRKGEELDIQSEWNDPKGKGRTLAIDSNPILRKIKRTKADVLIKRQQQEWGDIPEPMMKAGTETWACLPFVVGQRLIGAIALWRQRKFEPEEWKDLRSLADQAAPAVEMLMTFSEMAGHLRRLAVLNDFILTVSSAQNLDQIVSRVFGLMARAFGTEVITLYLPTSDKRLLRQYQTHQGKVTSQSFDAENHPVKKAIAEGRIQRLGDVSKSDGIAFQKDSRSALLVPLLYRGQAVGLFSIENERTDAFSEFDEHLMLVITSHLAGLIEYGRLREEAEGRARSLGLIHEVVQQVIGLMDKKQVTQITADLLAQYFRYELAAVFLLDDDRKMSIKGIGGTYADVFRKSLRSDGIDSGSGIIGYVLSKGESILVNDTSDSIHYKAIAGWDAGSELCVAIHEGNSILGVVDIESSLKDAFSHNDLVAMESLAGILASVISSATQYQKLQDTVQQLRVTQIELNQRMEALQAAENRLVQAAKLAAVGEMAAGIAHELNNPLTTVTGFSELLLDDMPANSNNRTELEMVLREARRASEVVRRLLDFSRQGERTRTSADLNEIIEDVIALTRHLIRTNGVTLEISLSNDLPWISADRNQMKQVILNLIHNALQAMPEGGKLGILTQAQIRQGRNWVVLQVIDNGIGISSEDKEKIFEPFFTTKSGQGGTGLGLSVSYGIITDHGGTIEVESEAGKGSTFSILLPT